MNFKRIGRVAICLLLVCVLLFNIVSIEAKATGIVEGLIAGASAINVPAAIAICATLVALGVMGKAADTEGTNMNNLVNQAQAHLESVGGWIQDGTMELIRTVDEAGDAMYYAGVDLFETLRGWLFDSEIVSVKELTLNPSLSIPSAVLAEAYAAPYSVLVYYTVNGSGPHYQLAYSYTSPVYAKATYSDGTGMQIGTSNSSAKLYLFNAYKTEPSVCTGIAFSGNSANVISSTQYFGTESPIEYVSSYDVDVGVLSSVPIDGTSAKEWAPDYASRGLHITQITADPDDAQVYLPIIPADLEDLLGMTQADQWSDTTTVVIPTYETEEEYDVQVLPIVDGYTAIEITPIADTGTDSGTDDGLLSSILSAIKAIPAAFAEWFDSLVSGLTNVIEAVVSLPASIAEAFSDVFTTVTGWLEGIWEGITSLPSMILNGLEALLTKLFAPSEEFMQANLQGLMDKYTFIQPMLDTGNEFKSWFQGIGTTPPIIWIDLGAGTGWYPMGGKVKFIDLTWFEQYKSTSDGIIAAFLWLWFIWRILQTLPGIVQGFTGVIGSANHVPDAPFNSSPAPTNLLTGSEYRSSGDGSKRTWRRNGV